jgi:hypothetical protein
MTADREPMLEFRAPKPRFARSINVERDAGSESIDSYLPVARAIDTVHRLAVSLSRTDVERALSVTGPYGSGKSSLVILIDALLGPPADRARVAADDLLSSADPDTARLLAAARRDMRAERHGFIRCLVTAQREPVALTVVRALRSGIERFLTRCQRSQLADTARRLDQLQRQATAATPRHIEAREIKMCLQSMTGTGPVLIAIDEFGKNLEAFADSRSDADLFLLQELAEWTRGERGLPVVLLTMQHMAFDEYALGATAAHRREWAKIQGRFEDVPFVDSPAQTRTLIAAAFNDSPNRGFTQRTARWAAQQAARARLAGLGDLADDEALARTWPLHPLALLVLPELCQRYGQNERTLFSFLAGSEPRGIHAWLKDTSLPVGDELPCVRLDRLYGYFLESASTLVSVSSAASRWLEVDTRIRDAHGLDAAQRRVVRTVGLLNLVASGGALRASKQIVAWSAADGSPGTQDAKAVERRLRELEALGLITFRDFADEYRVWQGSDFDIKNAIDQARRRLRTESVATLLERIRPLPPLVAGRHSHATGTLRTFTRHWVDERSRVTPTTSADRCDGTVLYALGRLPRGVVETRAYAKPVVIVTARNEEAVTGAAIEAAALRDVLTTDDRVNGLDWVAQRELEERLAEALTTLDAAFESVFGPETKGTRWSLLDDQGHTVAIPAPPGSAALSWVADEVYSKAPRVRNDLINRHKLSSQAAKARRELLEAMLNCAKDGRLGIEGFGPERAMYEAILKATGMHREDGETWRFAQPTSRSGYVPAWDAIVRTFNQATTGRAALDELFDRLAAPPYGLRAGLAPVLFTAALLVHREQVALYEHGTFRPSLTPEVLERLVRNPGHFQIKHFASRSGGRQALVEQLSTRLPSTLKGGGFRSGGVLAVVAQLMQIVALAPQHIRGTSNLSESTLRFREALEVATEPDELLFRAIPAAFDLPPLDPQSPHTQCHLTGLTDHILAAVSEIQSAYPVLLEEIRHRISDVCGVPRDRLRMNLAERGAILVGKVIQPRMRGFLSAITSDIGDDDDSWTEYVAMTVSEIPPQAWTDDDRVGFFSAVRDIGGTFRRLEALNHDQLAGERDGFGAMRVTVTLPDGAESARVVWVDEHQRLAIASEVDELIARVATRLGSDGLAEDTVLALLASRQTQTATTAKADTAKNTSAWRARK